jgi:hypothetical protein
MGAEQAADDAGSLLSWCYCILLVEVGKHGGYSILKSTSHKSSSGSFNRVIKPMTHVVGIEFKAPFTAVYMAKVHTPKLWDELSKRKQEINNPIDKKYRTGVSLSRNRIYHYIAGIEVRYEIPFDRSDLEIPAYRTYTRLPSS